MATTSPNEHYGQYIQSWMDEQTEKNLNIHLCQLTRWMSAWIIHGYPIARYQTGKEVEKLCQRLQLLYHIYRHGLHTKDHSVNVYMLAGELKRPLASLREDLNFLHDFGLALPDIGPDDEPTIMVTSEGMRLLLCASKEPHPTLH